MWYLLGAGAVLGFVGVIVFEYRRLQWSSGSASFPIIPGGAGSPADVDSRLRVRVAGDRDMDDEDAERAETLLRACDEVLAYHERAGSSQAGAATQVRAKRDELHERLALSTVHVPESAS